MQFLRTKIHNLKVVARFESVSVAKIPYLCHLRFHLSRLEVNFDQKIFKNADLSSIFVQKICDRSLFASCSKIHNSVNFYRFGPIFLHKVTDLEIYNFSSKVETGFCSNQYPFLLKNVSESTLEPKISLSELKLQKFITNSLFIRLRPFLDRS